ncbi:LysR family transcriptional regulator [Ligilactobacillus sp. WILCCON 0076]|uniref:LysR family transcriptional regulator n=1 Tax=Ligilactobacillus ubinensis TaxID=2876789 RepID=A0A9X2FKB0_9LACO|nr:LysR family transcriptional regulator [Ligilactobacillus ubinensis]MCP0887254.1 LysR family transcriptional regulator [Ligilactobacillus ubinensis]
MNLQQLQYLSVLAQTENYTKAAKILHITQPTLSYAINNLEEQIGIQLFEKHGRSIKLTQNGKSFAAESAQALEILNQAIERARNINSTDKTIKIASLRTLNTLWLPNTIKDFLEKRSSGSIEPYFDFGSGTGFSLQMTQLLREEKFDICFCSKIDDKDDIDYFPVVEQKLVLITPFDHPLANKKSIDLTETLKYNQITFSSNSGLYFELERLFSICGGTPKSIYKVEEDESVAGMVAAGFGIAVVPKMRMLDRMAVKIIPIRFPKWHRFIYMATLKKHYQNAVTQEFIDFVHQFKGINDV